MLQSFKSKQNTDQNVFRGLKETKPKYPGQNTFKAKKQIRYHKQSTLKTYEKAIKVRSFLASPEQTKWTTDQTNGVWRPRKNSATIHWGHDSCPGLKESKQTLIFIQVIPPPKSEPFSQSHNSQQKNYRPHLKGIRSLFWSLFEWLQPRNTDLGYPAFCVAVSKQFQKGFMVLYNRESCNSWQV